MNLKDESTNPRPLGGRSMAGPTRPPGTTDGSAKWGAFGEAGAIVESELMESDRVRANPMMLAALRAKKKLSLRRLEPS